MNCSVSAGPAMALPAVRAVGPQMCALRMPILLSVLLDRRGADLLQRFDPFARRAGDVVRLYHLDIRLRPPQSKNAASSSDR